MFPCLLAFIIIEVIDTALLGLKIVYYNYLLLIKPILAEQYTDQGQESIIWFPEYAEMNSIYNNNRE